MVLAAPTGVFVPATAGYGWPQGETSGLASESTGSLSSVQAETRPAASCSQVGSKVEKQKTHVFCKKRYGGTKEEVVVNTCYFNGKLKGAPKKYPSHVPWRALSLDEEGCKPPEVDKRPTGYQGWGPGLLTLYTFAQQMQMSKPAPKGVCLHTNVHIKEYIHGSQDLKRTHESKGPIKLTHEEQIGMSNKGLGCFFANCTSFSNKVQHYLKMNRSRFHVVGLMETHDEHINAKQSFWKGLSYKPHANPARSTSKGSHGRETLATHDNINPTDVPLHVWNIIVPASTVELSIAAKIITLHKKQTITCTMEKN